MRYLMFLILFILGYNIMSYSQVSSKEFGEIGMDEFKMSSYSNDKDAEAVVLFDLGKSWFMNTDNSFDVIFERTTRIKIFSEAGIKYAEVEIPFYREENIQEKIYDIEAFTYNFIDGRLIKTEVDKNSFHDEKVNDFWQVRKFALPNVKEGSVIEYKYKIQSQYHFNLRDWEFQWRIPVIYSEYEVRMIPFYQYTWLLQGAGKFSSQTSSEDGGFPKRFGSVEYRDYIHKYIMTYLPAFNDEEFISSINDYIIKIDFQLSKIIYPNGAKIDVVKTWPDLIKDLLKNEDFGKYIKKSEKLAGDLINENDLSGKTPMEKFDFILNYVKTNYKWNSDYRKYASKSPGQFIKDKLGNIADINLFTVGLLNSIGIEANPLIISTRKNGKIKIDYPFAHFFNSVIIAAKIEDKVILSDATEVFLQNDRIPVSCINDKGLVVKKDAVEWLGLECNFFSGITTFIYIDSISDTYEAHVRTIASEYDANNIRNKYGENAKKIGETLKEKGYELVDDEVLIKNSFDIKKPYVYEYNVSFKTEMINDKILISPFLNEPISENPLKQNVRNYPVDMIYPVTRSYRTNIKIPAGYKVIHKGEDYDIDNELFAFEYDTKQMGDFLQVQLSYSFKKAIYGATDYLKIKFYFNEIVKRANEKVVLSKV